MNGLQDPSVIVPNSARWGYLSAATCRGHKQVFVLIAPWAITIQPVHAAR